MAVEKLYRLRQQRLIGGVCAGFSKYFKIDISLMRLIWIILGIAGVGVIAYIASLIIIPIDPEENESENKTDLHVVSHKKTLGVILISIGLLLFLVQLEVIDYLFSFHFSWKLIWGILLILVGIILLLKNFSGAQTEMTLKSFQDKFIRPREGRMFFGVCIGLARYFKIDVSFIRIFWALATLASHGIGLIAYFILVIIFPSDEEMSKQTQSPQ